MSDDEIEVDLIRQHWFSRDFEWIMLLLRISSCMLLDCAAIALVDSGATYIHPSWSLKFRI